MCLEKSPTVAKEECNFSEPKNQQQHNELVKDSGLLVAVDRVGVDDDATKAEIKRAFVKSLKTKKLNKKVLGEFVELVA